MTERRAGLNSTRKIWWRFLGLVLLIFGVARWKRHSGSPGACRSSGSSSSPREVSWIPVPGGSLRVSRLSRKAGWPLLFLHSIGGRLEHWDQVFDALSHDPPENPVLDSIALELPGHGESDPSAEDMSVESIVRLIGAVLDSQGWRRTTLVAHSSSTGIAFAFANSRPDRVSGIMLLDPSGDQLRLPEEQRSSLARAIAADPHAELEWHFRQLLAGASEKVRRIVESDLRQSDANVIAELAIDSLELDLTSLSTAYEGPKVALISDFNDTDIAIHRLDRTVQARPSRLGHWPMLEDPIAVADAVGAFVGQCHQWGSSLSPEA